MKRKPAIAYNFRRLKWEPNRDRTRYTATIRDKNERIVLLAEITRFKAFDYSVEMDLFGQLSLLSNNIRTVRECKDLAEAHIQRKLLPFLRVVH